MRFNDLRKDELVQAAEHYKVEIDADATKAEISTALLDAGKTPEEWETDRELWGKGDAEVQSKQSSALTLQNLREAEYEQERKGEEPEEEEAPKKAAPEPDDDLVLVRFTGKNRSYRSGRHKFDAVKPFALMSRDEFEALDAAKFREATKAEANEFYG